MACLSSCLAVVVAGAATGLIVYDKRSLSTMEKDVRIFHRVNHVMTTQPTLKDAHISIVSFNQIVLLVGQTPKASQRRLAEKLTYTIPDVKRVYNQLVITKPTNFSTKAQDSWITSQTRSSLMQKKGLKSGSIRVITEQSVVYLMGHVTREQALLASDAARHIAGVKKVVRVFQYR
tara:strand:+ start:1674 stop:2201 length:528 start_codon:yes stop_codon:yes gene_type:complete